MKRLRSCRIILQAKGHQVLGLARNHVEDAADLYISALETGTAKGLYNVSAETVSLKDLNEAGARLLQQVAIECALAGSAGIPWERGHLCLHEREAVL